MRNRGTSEETTLRARGPPLRERRGSDERPGHSWRRWKGWSWPVLPRCLTAARIPTGLSPCDPEHVVSIALHIKTKLMAPEHPSRMPVW